MPITNFLKRLCCYESRRVKNGYIIFCWILMVVRRQFDHNTICECACWALWWIFFVQSLWNLVLNWRFEKTVKEVRVARLTEVRLSHSTTFFGRLSLQGSIWCFMEDSRIWRQMNLKWRLLMDWSRSLFALYDIMQRHVTSYHALQVNLLHVIDEMAGTFSGGMKRRLSVAISMIGQPLCCYLVSNDSRLFSLSHGRF